MKTPLDIALLVKTEANWHRNVLMGVAQYAEDQGGWNFTIPPADAEGEVFPPKGWRGDGIICRVTSEELEGQITELGLPCVNVSWLSYSAPSISSVFSDEPGCALMAARFLLEKQYEHFAYIGFPPWQRHTNAFDEAFRTLEQ